MEDKVTKAIDLLLGKNKPIIAPTPQPVAVIPVEAEQPKSGFAQQVETEITTIAALKEAVRGMNFEDAYSLFINLNNVPKEQALLFSDIYNPTRRLSPEAAFRILHTEVNNQVDTSDIKNAPEDVKVLIAERTRLEKGIATETFEIRKNVALSRISEINKELRKYEDVVKQQNKQAEEDSAEMRKRDGIVYKNATGDGNILYITVNDGLVHFMPRNKRIWQPAPEFMQNNEAFSGFLKTTLTTDQALEIKQESKQEAKPIAKSAPAPAAETTGKYVKSGVTHTEYDFGTFKAKRGDSVIIEVEGTEVVGEFRHVLQNDRLNKIYAVVKVGSKIYERATSKVKLHGKPKKR